MKTQPNILFLMTDQLRLDHTGFGGSKRVPTPNIDRIAEGTAFLNCSTTNPICTPARSALLTGKYTHQIGMVAMSGDLSLQHPTYPQALRRAGYETWGIGKFHFLQTWRWGAGRGNGVDLVALKEKTREYGFDHVWETAGKQLSRQNYCDYCAYLDEKGVLDTYRDFVDTAGKNTNSVHELGVEARNGDPSPLADEDHVDYVTADRIIEAIGNRPADRPFFIFGSFCSPHKPYDPPQSYIDAEPDEPWEPISDGEPLDEANRSQLDRQSRSYRALVRFTDDQVGRVCDALEREGLLDSTVILFTTDHGEMLGDHGRVQKGSYYRSSLTVPTAIRHPDHLDGRSIMQPVELTDLTATILELAGIDPAEALSKPWPAFHDRVPCTSLLPLVTGDADSVRECSFSECNGEWQAVCDERYKYVRLLRRASVEPVKELLFDLAEDPEERIDLSSRARITEGESELATALARLRAYREWVMDTTPPAQTRWAPLPEAGEEYTYG